ncbi:hypothetical protein KCP75_00825 [Salmonella enterica subsp. enterica]|nr:hypothetical protein KCP75_00825 [Salmonella enterica subsp. enterica]
MLTASRLRCKAAGQRRREKCGIGGFRKAKYLPMNIVAQRYGASVRRDVLERLMSRNFVETRSSRKLTGRRARTMFRAIQVGEDFTCSVGLKSIRKLS